MEKFKSAVQKVELTNRLNDANPFGENDCGIKVCVRVRCFIKEELEGQRSGGATKLCIGMHSKTDCTMFRDEPKDERNFTFDRCYWSHNPEHPLFATQETLMSELGNSMIKNAMDGYNNCMFAYGQTGSGKSFSVLGGKGEARGLLPRVVEGLFEYFESPEMEEFEVKTMVAFLEIYNENLHDLLAPKTNEPKAALQVKQHPTLGVFVPGLTEAPVDKVEEVLNLVDYGNTMRHVSATAMNASSSRSHCVFTFKTSTTEKGSGQVKMSQTHLVDLAGSERAGRTQAEGDRLKEGAAINQSLSSLARVISKLAEASTKKKGAKVAPPPFRDSKLTYILKESLSGNSKTVMMAAISPNLPDYDETLSTMKFAQSVKMIQTKATANTVNVGGIEAQLRMELDALRAQLAKCEEQLAAGPPAALEAEATEEALIGEQQVMLVDSQEIGGQRVSLIRQRMQEQEQLIAWYGFNSWDALVEEERKRMKKREAVLKSSVDLAAFKEEIAERLESTTVPRKDSGDSDSESPTEAEQRLRFLLAPVQDPSYQEAVMGRKTMRALSESYLAIVGPVAQELENQQDLYEDALEARMNNRILQLKRDAAETELDVTRMLRAEDKTLHLKVMVCVDPEDPGQPDISIHSMRDGRLEDVFTEKELAGRSAWIRERQLEQSQEGDADDYRSRFDIWEQSKIAVMLPEFFVMQEQLTRAQADVKRLRHRVSVVEVLPREVDAKQPDAARSIAQKIANTFESAISVIDETMEKQTTMQALNQAKARVRR